MNTNRHEKARQIRISAADMAYNRAHPRHVTNGEEQKFRKVVDGRNMPSYLASFTKGMPHDYDTGLIENPDDFKWFVLGTDSGDPRDFIDTELGPSDDEWKSTKAKEMEAKVRGWESQGAGLAFDLEGPDSWAVTMPPAPAVGSDELIAEIAEVYAQALLRDVPFTEIVNEDGKVGCKPQNGNSWTLNVEKILHILNELPWFNTKDCCDLKDFEIARMRGHFNGQTVFRGITEGDDIGPYISQFLLAGNKGVNGNDQTQTNADGLVAYGAIRIDQRVRVAKPCEDHLTTWNEWYDAQNGADFRGMESFQSGKNPAYRFITTPRDLATYVHYDALYEAYLNACLIMLGEGIPFDPGLPFHREDHIDHQQGFAHFGGPHILSLVTEVATRALKAARFQKFNIHRRLRPEALAGRIAKHDDLNSPDVDRMVKELKPILNWVGKANPLDEQLPHGNWLLPMAFCEGSPMHPSYAAGHATVAGACVTILKAFFDHKHPLEIAGDASWAFIPTADGTALETTNVVNKEGHPSSLTIEGELNKLASNISIGRNWAGVHYFTDYIESLRMGEQIAIGILEEQKLTYGENFSMTVPLFDGGSIRI